MLNVVMDKVICVLFCLNSFFKYFQILWNTMVRVGHQIVAQVLRVTHHPAHNLLTVLLTITMP